MRTIILTATALLSVAAPAAAVALSAAPASAAVGSGPHSACVINGTRREDAFSPWVPLVAQR